MFKRELKVNLKSFIIWLLILIGIFSLAYIIYPSIINSDNIKMIDEMMKLFPEEVLIAFNMDISSMDSAFGWLKSEGFVFALLIIGCYASLLGSNIILKEENDKYIAKVYLNVKFYDYIENSDNGLVLRGTALKKLNNIYILTFVRSKEEHKDINMCPRCSAPVEGNSTGICEYCKSKLINETHDWVMSKKEKISQR